MVAQTAATILPIGKRCLVPTWLPVSPHAADNAGAIRRLGTLSYIAAHGSTRYCGAVGDWNLDALNHIGGKDWRAYLTTSAEKTGGLRNGLT